MKVFKYVEFLFEGNTPEDYIAQCLTNIQNRLEQAFNPDEDGDKVKKMSDFSKFNLKLEDIRQHLHSYSEKNLTCKFSDEEGNLYILNVRMLIEDAVNANKDQDYKISDIKKAHVTFKKYNDEDGSLDLKEQLLDRTVDPESIDGNFLIKLKQDLDSGKDPGEEDEFKIETDDDKPQEENPNEAGDMSVNAQGQLNAGQAQPAQSSNQNVSQETV